MWKIMHVSVPNLDTFQFGVHSNLAANQFESSVDMRLTEDWHIELVGDVVRPAIGEGDMKFKLVVPAIVILMIANFPVLAKNTRPFFLRTAVTMNGAEVPAGIYDLSWE